MAQMTSKALIARKTDIDKRKNGKMVVTIGDLGDWEFMIPSTADFLDAQEYEKNHAKTADNNANVYLLYNMCVSPDLHDKELQEAYGVHGSAIVNAILLPGEVKELVNALMDRAGYADDSDIVISDEVKNS